MILTLYWALLSVSQIGFCVLLVFARSQETKVRCHTLQFICTYARANTDKTFPLFTASTRELGSQSCTRQLALCSLGRCMGENSSMSSWHFSAGAHCCAAQVLQFFIASTIFLGLIVALLLYANFRLLLRPSVATLWEIAFIHVPVRLFFVAVFTVDFWQSLFIAIGFSSVLAHIDIGLTVQF